MKAKLYAVPIAGGCNTHLTIHWEADLQYWAHRGSVGKVAVLQQDLPISLAVFVKETVERYPQAATPKEWLAQVQKAIATAGGNESPGLQLIAISANGQYSEVPAMYNSQCAKGYRTTTGNYAELSPSFSAASTVPKAETLYQMISQMRGRMLLVSEYRDLMESVGLEEASELWPLYAQWAYLLGELELTSGMSIHQTSKLLGLRLEVTFRCRRCGSGPDKHYPATCVICGDGCRYCEECLTMGRCRPCSLILCGVPVNSAIASNKVALPIDELLEPWGLSPAQYEASGTAIRFLQQPGQWTQGKVADKMGRLQAAGRHETMAAHAGYSLGSRGTTHPIREAPAVQVEPMGFLIWAVTGAGKTEMIFPLIAFELSRGGRVAVATPRRDVVLELKPRLQRAFPHSKLTTLYGGSGERWETGDITLATTHQLLRFGPAFDLVIIDELDAFPFHNNDSLQYAARRVCKPKGKYIFLSATPPGHLQQAARRKKLPHVKVPVRYHRHPLPVPHSLRIPPLHQVLARNTIPPALYRALSASIVRGAQLFVFVPVIRHVEPFVQLLRSRFPGMRIEGTSSKDADRAEKVQQFRDGTIRLLVTTTILERGVTVPKTDVFILGADSPLFDEAALVQMAGRAGRSKDDPAGRVFFAADQKTSHQAGAIGQIRMMNRVAKKKGYLANDDSRKGWKHTVMRQR